MPGISGGSALQRTPRNESPQGDAGARYSSPFKPAELSRTCYGETGVSAARISAFHRNGTPAKALAFTSRAVKLGSGRAKKQRRLCDCRSLHVAEGLQKRRRSKVRILLHQLSRSGFPVAGADAVGFQTGTRPDQPENRGSPGSPGLEKRCDRTRIVIALRPPRRSVDDQPRNGHVHYDAASVFMRNCRKPAGSRHVFGSQRGTSRPREHRRASAPLRSRSPSSRASRARLG